MKKKRAKKSQWKKKFKLSVQICKRFSSVILFKSFFRRLCKKTKKNKSYFQKEREKWRTEDGASSANSYTNAGCRR